MIKRSLFFGNPVYLSMRHEQLKVSFPDNKKEAKTVPIEDIGYVVLEHPQITITHGLIRALLDNKAAVITCDEKRLPAGFLQPLNANSTQAEIARSQISASKPLKKQLWQQTIVAKIRNQSHALKYLDLPNKKLERWIPLVKSGDKGNHEAMAAAYYFQTLFDHSDFSRNDKDIPPNHWLNYGYAILRAIAARAIVSSGMLPVLGIFHRNKYNAYALADDIMEPYRPYVDLLVHELVSEYGAIEEFPQSVKVELLRIPTLNVRIEERYSPLMLAMSRTTHSLQSCFAGSLRQIRYPSLE